MGVSATAVDAYLALARSGTAPGPEDCAELRARHLISDDGTVVPIRLATAAWAAAGRLRLANLESAAQSLSSFAPTSSSSFIQVLTGLAEVVTVFSEIQAAAQQQVRTFDRPPYLSTGAVEMSPDQPDAIARGVEFRTIYLSTNLHRSEIRSAVQLAVGMGEQARIHDDLPMRMMLSDRDRGLVILPQPDASVGDPEGVDALLVHPSPFLDALERLFESTWNRALPISLGENVTDENSAVDREILTLMSSGLTDARVATALGVSERTVARRISRMQVRLGAPSRFLLGVRAARDDLV